MKNFLRFIRLVGWNSIYIAVLWFGQYHKSLLIFGTVLIWISMVIHFASGLSDVHTAQKKPKEAKTRPIIFAISANLLDFPITGLLVWNDYPTLAAFYLLSSFFYMGCKLNLAEKKKEALKKEKANTEEGETP